MDKTKIVIECPQNTSMVRTLVLNGHEIPLSHAYRVMFVSTGDPGKLPLVTVDFSPGKQEKD